MTKDEVEIALLGIGGLIAALQIYGTAKIKSVAKNQGEIETKIKNLPELKEIAKAQASGKSSVEFMFQKKKDDSVKLIEFYELIQQYQSHILKKEVNLEEGMVSEYNRVSYSNLIMDEANKINEIELIYAMYFESYNHQKFNLSYILWMKHCKSNIKSIMELEIEKIELNENRIDESEYNTLFEKFKENNAVKTRIELGHALHKNISKLNSKILEN